ncbi:coiled-coil domain-containing protein 150-like [Acomys russatus]|uniref:coiled-coil domain-containing protein 150-like n=1 Tax=Acomys russatus TaxID=60746 RepID=UPI0021E200D0|nr:coiled-coil domain-containing protein 150-like [Acomys russatus]
MRSILGETEEELAQAVKCLDAALKESQKLSGDLEALEDRKSNKMELLQKSLDKTEENKKKLAMSLGQVLQTSGHDIQEELEK